MHKSIKIGIGAIFFVAVVSVVVDKWDDFSHNCQPTGEQRLVNTVDGVRVSDKMRCDGGRVKWSL